MIDYDKLDPGTRNIVRYFNEQGLTTSMSCEGHYPQQPRMALFWVSFDKSVTQEDIQHFMQRHLNKKYHNFVSAGHFVRRFYVFDKNKVSETYMYEVGSKEAADFDLYNWKEDDKCCTGI